MEHAFKTNLSIGGRQVRVSKVWFRSNVLHRAHCFSFGQSHSPGGLGRGQILTIGPDGSLPNLDETLAQIAGPPSTVLVLNIFNTPHTQVTLEAVHALTNFIGPVSRILLFDKEGRTSAMVEYNNLETAVKAQKMLHRHHLWDNQTGLILVTFSKQTTLNILGYLAANPSSFSRARDYTLPLHMQMLPFYPPAPLMGAGMPMYGMPSPAPLQLRALPAAHQPHAPPAAAVHPHAPPPALHPHAPPPQLAPQPPAFSGAATFAASASLSSSAASAASGLNDSQGSSSQTSSQPSASTAGPYGTPHRALLPAPNPHVPTSSQSPYGQQQTGYDSPSAMASYAQQPPRSSPSDYIQQRPPPPPSYVQPAYDSMQPSYGQQQHSASNQHATQPSSQPSYGQQGFDSRPAPPPMTVYGQMSYVSNQHSAAQPKSALPSFAQHRHDASQHSDGQLPSLPSSGQLPQLPALGQPQYGQPHGQAYPMYASMGYGYPAPLGGAGMYGMAPPGAAALYGAPAGIPGAGMPGTAPNAVLTVAGLDKSHDAIEWLCNLLGYWGNVARIKFMFKKDDIAMVEFFSPEEAHTCLRFSKVT